MFKCPYCQRWECSCCQAVKTGGPDDEIKKLKELAKQCYEDLKRYRQAYEDLERSMDEVIKAEGRPRASTR